MDPLGRFDKEHAAGQGRGNRPADPFDQAAGFLPEPPFGRRLIERRRMTFGQKAVAAQLGFWGFHLDTLAWALVLGAMFFFLFRGTADKILLLPFLAITSR